MPNEFQLWEKMGKDILSSPDDDDLRLQFAFELENGEGADNQDRRRARLIRVQLKLNSLRTDHPEWMRLATEAYGLLLDNELEWTPPRYRDLGIRNPQFHRGFMECIVVAARVLLELHTQIFTLAPIRHLDLVDLPSGGALAKIFTSLSQHNYFGRIVSLRLDGQKIRDNDLQLLAREGPPNLRWLSLAHNEITIEGVRALMADNLRRLWFVDLHDNPFDPTEQMIFDQGVIIEKHLGPMPDQFFDLGWLRRQVDGGQPIYPSRFRTVRSRSQGRFLAL
jgi:hypothetical protein